MLVPQEPFLRHDDWLDDKKSVEAEGRKEKEKAAAATS